MTENEPGTQPPNPQLPNDPDLPADPFEGIETSPGMSEEEYQRYAESETRHIGNASVDVLLQEFHEILAQREQLGLMRTVVASIKEALGLLKQITGDPENPEVKFWFNQFVDVTGQLHGSMEKLGLIQGALSAAHGAATLALASMDESATAAERLEAFAEYFDDLAGSLSLLGPIMGGDDDGMDGEKPFKPNVAGGLAAAGAFLSMAAPLAVLGTFFLIYTNAIKAIAGDAAKIEAATQRIADTIRAEREAAGVPQGDANFDDGQAQADTALQTMDEAAAQLEAQAAEMRTRLRNEFGVTDPDNTFSPRQGPVRDAVAAADRASGLSQAAENLKDAIRDQTTVPADMKAAEQAWTDRQVGLPMSDEKNRLADQFERWSSAQGRQQAYQRVQEALTQWERALRAFKEHIRTTAERQNWTIHEFFWLKTELHDMRMDGMPGDLRWTDDDGTPKAPSDQTAMAPGSDQPASVAVADRTIVASSVDRPRSGRGRQLAIAGVVAASLIAGGIGVVSFMGGRESSTPPTSGTARSQIDPALAAFATILREAGLTDRQIAELASVAEADGTGDFIYSASVHRPGDPGDDIDIQRTAGTTASMDQAAADSVFNFTTLACDRADSITVVCPKDVGKMPAGEVAIVASVLKAGPPASGFSRQYIYGLALEATGKTGDDFKFEPPFDWDFFRDTETWYELILDPRGRAVLASRWNGKDREPRPSAARAVISGNTVTWFIPMSEFATPEPTWRVSAFRHDGSYDPDKSAGDVSGADPTEPLRGFHRSEVEVSAAKR